MAEEPRVSVSFGSLPLQEFPQQPFHLPVSGVGTFHRLLCVKTVKYFTENMSAQLPAENLREKGHEEREESKCTESKVGKVCRN